MGIELDHKRASVLPAKHLGSPAVNALVGSGQTVVGNHLVEELCVGHLIPAITFGGVYIKEEGGMADDSDY